MFYSKSGAAMRVTIHIHTYRQYHTSTVEPCDEKSSTVSSTVGTRMYYTNNSIDIDKIYLYHSSKSRKYPWLLRSNLVFPSEKSGEDLLLIVG